MKVLTTPSHSRTRPGMIRLCTCLFWLTSLGHSPAAAAWLELCPDNARAETVPLLQITDANGTMRSASLSEIPSGRDCARMNLQVPASEVLGLHPLPVGAAVNLGSRFSLSVRQDGQRTLISDIAPGKVPPSAAPAAAPLPLGRNLLTRLQATAFGSENRASARLVNAQLTLQCSAGLQPAGVRLTTQDLMPRARSRLQLTGHGTGTFELLSASASQATTGNASRLGTFAALPEAQSHQPREWLPEGSTWGASWRHWAIACPLEGGQLVIRNLQLLPVAAAVPGRATWVWQANDWQRSADTVIQRARLFGLTTLFITVPLHDGVVRDPVALQTFVERAASEGMSVWAVDGDPAMVLPSEHLAAAARARAYARFNRSAPATGRLRGVQFDVEPYLLQGHAMSEAQTDAHYMALVKALSEALKEPGSPIGSGVALDMVVPFWWFNRESLLASMAPLVSGLVVMDYRTDPADIYRFAVPFLDWGEVHGKNVRIALEAGPIASENRQHYAQADLGALWSIQLGGRHFLLMLKSPLKNPQGASFRLTGSYTQDGSATTFRNHLSDLWQQLPMLEGKFSAWRYFSGMALHELP